MATITRTDFQALSELRVQEAEVLLKAGHYAGAYYLLGYAIEAALKACVAKQVREHDFPDRRLAQEAYTHDLEKLVRIAGLQYQFELDRQASDALDLNWAVVKDWSEESRYDPRITERQARDLHSACVGTPEGVLHWMRKRW